MGLTKFTFRDWLIEADVSATQEEYAQMEKSSAEDCACRECLNYQLQRKDLFPTEVLGLFERLGINPLKEMEISHFADLNGGLHYYQGWFQFRGNFKGPDCRIPLGEDGFTLDLRAIDDSFSLGFTQLKESKSSERVLDRVQIEFDCKIPWVIESK